MEFGERFWWAVVRPLLIFIVVLLALVAVGLVVLLVGCS